MKTLTERAEQARIALQELPGWQVKFVSEVADLSPRWVTYFRAGEYPSPRVGTIDELNKALRIINGKQFQAKIKK